MISIESTEEKLVSIESTKVNENFKCGSCNFANVLKINNVWFHKKSSHTGDLEKNIDNDEYTKINISDDLSKFMPKLFTSELNNFFGHKLEMDLGESFKPDNMAVVWWSHSEWAFDPYGEMCCEDHCDDIDGSKGVVIQDPKHILHIRTFEELEKFADTWITPGKRRMCIINWNGIRDAGFAGVAFDFGKIYRLTDSIDIHYSDKYMWHCAYDVPSLITWDQEKAFNNTVYPVRFSLQ